MIKFFHLVFFLVTLGFLLTAFSQNLGILLLSMIITGIGFGFAVPYMYNWLGWSAPQNSVNLATTLVLVMVNVGCFVSPISFVLITIYALVHYVRVHNIHK